MDPLTWLSVGSNLLGGIFGNNAMASAKGDIMDMAAYNPWNASGGFGQFNMGGGAGNVSDSAMQQAYRGMFMPGMGMLSQGGMFGNQAFQDAWGGMDIAGAMQNYDQLGGLTPQAQAFQQADMMTGAGSDLLSQFQQGPQDLSGGVMGDLFSQGIANQMKSGDMGALRDQELATMRAAGQATMDRQFNQLNNRLHSMGMLGSTGGGEQMRGLMEAQGQQDLNFQNAAFGRAAQQSQLLQNLGLGQTQQAQGLLGQNIGQHQFTGNLAQGLLQGGAALENQLFQNQLASAGQAQSHGQQRLQNAMNLFGLGTNTFNQAFGMGLQGLQGMQGIDSLQLQGLLGLLNAESGRVGATGMHSQALSQLGQSQGGLFGGIFSGIGSMFS